MPGSERESAAAEGERPKAGRTWLIVVLVLLANIIAYHLTEPDAAYQPNVTFQILVSAELGICLIRAFLVLGRNYSIGQFFKVVFWAGALVYTLGDVVYFFRQWKFDHFPEALVLCYVFAVILQEKNPEGDPKGDEKGSQGAKCPQRG